MITDEEIVFDALRLYTDAREAFAVKINEEGYEKEDGSLPTKEERLHAIQVAAQCGRLTEYAKEKVDSPIIQLQ